MFRSAPIAVALTALVSWFSIQLRAPEWSGHVPEALETEIVVAIQLEKTRFLQNERIFLWTVTQRAEGERRPICGPQLDDGRVIYTRPDGTIRIDRMSAPIDGAGVRNPFDLGFRGGWTLSDEAPQIGRWSVVYEMGNARSAPAEFTIEAPAAFKGLEAYFEFSTPRVYSPAATATLAVRNGSREVLRFVEPGQNYSIVWGHLHGGKHNGSLSIPECAGGSYEPQTRPGRCAVSRLGVDSYVSACNHRTRRYLAAPDSSLALACSRLWARRRRAEPVDRTAARHRRTRWRVARVVSGAMDRDWDDEGADAVARRPKMATWRQSFQTPRG